MSNKTQHEAKVDETVTDWWFKQKGAQGSPTAYLTHRLGPEEPLGGQGLLRLSLKTTDVDSWGFASLLTYTRVVASGNLVNMAGDSQRCLKGSPCAGSQDITHLRGLGPDPCFRSFSQQMCPDLLCTRHFCRL